MLCVICTPQLAQSAADLADGAARAECLVHRRQEIRLGSGDAAHLFEGFCGSRGVALGARASSALALATLGMVHVPSAPVEAVIALSIVFVASEILRSRSGERACWVLPEAGYVTLKWRCFGSPSSSW